MITEYRIDDSNANDCVIELAPPTIWHNPKHFAVINNPDVAGAVSLVIVDEYGRPMQNGLIMSIVDGLAFLHPGIDEDAQVRANILVDYIGRIGGHEAGAPLDELNLSLHHAVKEARETAVAAMTSAADDYSGGVQ